MKINRYFDHAVLKPNMTEQEVKDAIQLGIDYDVYSVCVRPCERQHLPSSMQPREWLRLIWL